MTNELPREGTAPEAAPVTAPEATAAAAPDPAAAFGALLRAVTPTAPVVPAVIAINVGLLVAMVATGVSALQPSAPDLVRWGADFGPRTLGGQPWRLLTNAFLHFGLVHLAMNMFALWDAGRLVERMFGSARFAALYLAAALGGSVASVALHPQVVGAGASGAVFGVYGALGVFLWRAKGSVPPPVLARLARVAVFFIGYNVIYGFAHPNIDNAAHLGGLAAGALAALVLVRPLVPGRALRPAAPAAVLAVALVVAAGAAVALPKPPDFEATMAAFSETERSVIAAYRELGEQAGDRRITAEELADGIEARVLAPWQEARRRLAEPQRWDARQREVLDVITRFAAARAEEWTALAEAVRKRDDRLLEHVRSHRDEADRILEEFKRLPRKEAPARREKYRLPE